MMLFLAHVLYAISTNNLICTCDRLRWCPTQLTMRWTTMRRRRRLRSSPTRYIHKLSSAFLHLVHLIIQCKLYWILYHLVTIHMLIVRRPLATFSRCKPQYCRVITSSVLHYSLTYFTFLCSSDSGWNWRGYLSSGMSISTVLTFMLSFVSCVEELWFQDITIWFCIRMVMSVVRSTIWRSFHSLVDVLRSKRKDGWQVRRQGRHQVWTVLIVSQYQLPITASFVTSTHNDDKSPP